MIGSRAYCNPEVLGQIAGLSLRARRIVEGTISGQHKSPFHGFNVEFAAYREYAPGDDLKRLDWRLFARSDRFYIKQYEEESNLRALLVLDASASMGYGKPGSNKYDVAATAAACLATLLVEQRDPVGLAIVDHAERLALQPAATQAQIVQLVTALEQAKPERDTNLGPILETLGEVLKRRGLIVVISDLLTDLDSFATGLDRLRLRGHEIIVLQVLHRDELDLPFDDLVQFKDIEGFEEIYAEPRTFRSAYRHAMDEFLEQAANCCSERGIDHVLAITDEDLGATLSHYLHARMRTQYVRAETAGRHRAVKD